MGYEGEDGLRGGKKAMSPLPEQVIGNSVPYIWVLLRVCLPGVVVHSSLALGRWRQDD